MLWNGCGASITAGHNYKGATPINIFDILKDKGFNTLPPSFYQHINVWRSWYDGKVKGFHDYKVYNGINRVSCERYTMGMGKKVCEDWANLLLNEKVNITLEGKQEQAFVDAVLSDNNFKVKANESQELKAALGTAAYVLRIEGALVDLQTCKLSGDAGTIKIDYCTADNIFPLSWDNGRVLECVFVSDKIANERKYKYLQIHRLQRGQYVIEHELYMDNNGELSRVNNTDVPGFESVPNIVYTGSDKPQFVIDRLNIVNNVDPTYPLGIAAFANAIDQLKGVDISYDSYVNEFVLGKKRIMVKPEAMTKENGEPIFDASDTVYYVMPEDSQNESYITPIDMTLRTTEHNAGIQDMLNVLSSKCGFGENHYRYNVGNITTATQVISENGSMFRTLKKHEIILEAVLIELCRLILKLGNTYMSAGLNEDVNISIDFDDSIIEDKDKDFSRDMQLLSMGILNAWEFRAKWLNEDETTAKAALPGMEDMTTEQQTEVE